MQIHQPNTHSNSNQALCTRAKPNLPKIFNNTKYTFVPSVTPVLRRHQKTNGTTKENFYVSLQTNYITVFCHWASKLLYYYISYLFLHVFFQDQYPHRLCLKAQFDILENTLSCNQTRRLIPPPCLSSKQLWPAASQLCLVQHLKTGNEYTPSLAWPQTPLPAPLKLTTNLTQCIAIVVLQVVRCNFLSGCSDFLGSCLTADTSESYSQPIYTTNKQDITC